jgi:DNA-binding Xre family transcriptional regulator
MVTKWKIVPFLFNAGKFGLAIRLKIDNVNITQEDVAGMAGISDTTVSRIASGLHANIEMNTFLGICNALDLNPLDYLELGE